MMALPAAIAGDVDPLSTRDLDALKPLTATRAWKRGTNGGRERHQQRLRLRQRQRRLGSQVLLLERQLALPARHVLYLHLCHKWVSTECWVNILNDSSPAHSPGPASFAHLQLTPSAEAEQTICLLCMRVTLPRLNHFKFMNYFDYTLYPSLTHSHTLLPALPFPLFLSYLPLLCSFEAGDEV